MPLHSFNAEFTPTPRADNASLEMVPLIATHPQGLEQLSDVEGGRTKFLGDSTQAHPDFIQEFLMPGFRALDEGMKNYWSGMKIPTKDSTRMMRVKIAGGDKTILAWRDLMSDGRARLPVASLNRLSFAQDPRKFSPPYLSMTRRYTSNRMDRVALVKRPVPFLVTYELIVWASYKKDAEHILYQILTRFNPLAEFKLYDDHISGVVVLKCDGSTDHDEKAKVRYEFKMTAEAWLPLPETIVPTILGQVSSVRESATQAQLLSASVTQTQMLSAIGIINQPL